ncbi:protein kinase domain-containing protein [Nocardia sp. CA-107356]|uniref:protein kinase domain-containing protein n=1 Tax=Nocardia sp. CA-107356 TaxID=3239972 RepID=UPI003D931585
MGERSVSGGDVDKTRRDLRLGISDELAVAGFDEPEEIGRGGFGTVYRCTEHSLDRTVAVKVLHAEIEEDDRRRFLREQRALGKFSAHPNIVQVLHADVTASGRPFLVMPFHARGSLAARVRTSGPFEWQEVLSIGIKMAGALAVAHTCGIVHRDVNPANVLISDYGEPQLADFGIARVSGGFETDADLITGTPAYTAPEVLRGEQPTVASDLYGLGATLFTLLTGHAAFERKAEESMVAQFVRITSQPIPDLCATGVPALVCAAIEAAMAHDPPDRPRSAREYGERLRNIEFACGLPVDKMALPTEPDSAVGHLPEPTGPPQPPLPTPTTRYRPPRSPRRLVERPRLLRELRDGQPRRLVLIHAPPGFGKTTLAAQWVDVLKADGIPVAWLSVVADDNNVVWFLTHLVEALRLARPALAGELAQILEEESSDAASLVMTTLINDIHHGDEPVALVVDDWHRVTSRATIGAMRFLLDNACHHLRLIVTSRTAIGLPLGRMRVQDELVEIDEGLLRFDTSEAERFLVEVNNLPLAAPEVDQLCESTEGWVAALQLASLSLRGKDNPAAHIGQISGQHYAVGEYLMENVVETLEPDVLEFMMRTSVTDTICGDLAEALTGAQSGQEMLEDVRRRDLFLRNIDDDDLRWFRYHGLFADFLRRRLIRQQPGTIERLHAIASRWFAEHDMLAEAVDHALAADAPDRAMRLVEEHADTLIENSRMASLLGLVGKLPSSIAESSPRLQLAVAWANIPLQRPAAAHIALERVETVLASPSGADDATDLRFEADLVRVAESLVTDRFQDLPESVVTRLQSPVRPFLAHVAAGIAAGAALYRFDFDAVHRWHDWATPYRVRASGPFGVVWSDCIAGMAAVEQLDIADAERAFRAALQLALRTGSRSNATRQASALLSELLYQKGQFIEAGELLESGHGIAAGGVEFLLANYGTGARLAALRGDLPGADQRLTEGQRLAKDLALPRLSARIVNEQVRLGLPISAAERDALDRLPPYRRQTNQLLSNVAELAQDSAIRLLLARRTPATARSATDRAAQLLHEIDQQPRPWAALHARLLYGCCLVASEHTAQAIEQATPALAQCARLGLVRVVVDSGPSIAPVIEALSEVPEQSGLPRPFLQQLLGEIESEQQRRAGRH